ncbi:hypothetical protein DYB30_000505 [Aphanomyces astaci]|uniref:Cyclic nucleotide-binding domain-containing protein n=1 Tax=Aphanomyces astaci TaxID=112090 RepID=A0A397DGF0_APHAT|nr:hypothetical protein DYB30_000505 [Aphanomyces astaci]
MTDIDQTYDQLFQREVVQIPPRLAVEPQVEVDTQNQTHKLAKFRCLMNRDVTFVHALPHGSNHLLNSLVTEASNSFSNGRYSECMLQLKKCCVLNTDAANRPTLFFNQAVVLAHAGDFARAMADLNEAIKLDPEVFRYYKLRRYIEASKDSKRAVSIEHNQAGHKHAHQVTRKALKAIAIVNTTQHVKVAIACRVLTLEHTVYKHTMKKVMMEGAFARALFFTTTGIFAEWTDEQRNTLGVLSENLYYNAGDVVVTEGAPALHLYFVQSGLCGAVRLLGAHQPTHIQVATLSTGDIFGEAAVLDPINGSFQFTIVANTICKIIRIEKNYLNKKNGFELLRLGTITKRILTKIQQFSVRCPQDKLLVQMIRDNCSWKLERKKVLNAFAKDMSKACGKLPRVRSEPQLPKGHKLQFS